MPQRFASAWVLGTSALMAAVVLQFNLPNLGNNLLPRNLFAWALLVAATGGLWVYAVRQPQFYWSNGCYFWLIPPSAVMLHSVFMPAAQPHYALLAAGALLVFSLWLVGLVQARLSDQAWYRISQVVLGGAFVLVLLALPTANYLNRPEWLQSLPLGHEIARGGLPAAQRVRQFSGICSDLGLGHAVAGPASVVDRSPGAGGDGVFCGLVHLFVRIAHRLGWGLDLCGVIAAGRCLARLARGWVVGSVDQRHRSPGTHDLSAD